MAVDTVMVVVYTSFAAVVLSITMGCWQSNGLMMLWLLFSKFDGSAQTMMGKGRRCFCTHTKVYLKTF